MLRLRTALLILLFVAIADAASKATSNYYAPQLILVIASLAAWYIFGTSINDLADEEIDQVNLRGNPNRPLINKQIDRKQLWRIALTAAIVNLLLSIGLGGRAIIASLSALALSYIYSMPPLQLSYRGIIAPLFLPLGYVVYPFLLTFTANHAVFSADDYWLLAALYVSFTARIILKDFRDIKGDRQFGKRTFAVRHGTKATCLVSAMSWLIGVGLIVVRFNNFSLLWLALVPFITGIFWALKMLSDVKATKLQIQWVGLIGRLGNGTAILILATLYAELTPAKSSIYSILIIGLAIFYLNTTYVLYKPLLKNH